MPSTPERPARIAALAITGAITGLMLDTAATAQPCRLLIFGDSLAAAWSAPPPAGWIQTIHGQPGGRATAIAPALPALLQAQRPHAVLILAGSNDARAAALWPWGDAVAQAQSAIAAMARTGAASGAQLLVARLAPLGRQGWWRQLLIGDRQSQAMQAIEAGLDLPAGTGRLDLPKLLAGPDGGIDSAFRIDHIHLNQAGYARLAAGLRPLLAGHCPPG